MTNRRFILESFFDFVKIQIFGGNNDFGIEKAF